MASPRTVRRLLASGTPESLSHYVLLNDIPIDRLQALPLNYGEPTPDLSNRDE